MNMISPKYKLSLRISRGISCLKALSLYAFCLLMPGLMSSCSNSTKEGKALHASIGQPSEVLLVLDKEVMASEVKDTLKAILECDVPGLTQSESYFRVSRVPYSIYKGEMLKMHSKLMVRIDDQQAKDKRDGEAQGGVVGCQLKVAYDVDAKPQIQLLLTAPSVTALREYLQTNAGRVRDLLCDHQLAMQRTYLQRHHSKKVRNALKEMGLDGLLPEEIAWVKKGDGFLWGSSRTNEKQLNFVCYEYASDGNEMADLESLVRKRDSVMAVNIPGSMPDQWMETVWEKEAPVVQLEQRTRDDRMLSEMRGLWQMRHGAMGGPFVSYSYYDSARGKTLVVEGFVFSPSTEKRDLMRRLEAGMRTVKPVE